MSNITTNTQHNTVPDFSGLQLSNSANPVVRERERDTDLSRVSKSFMV